MSPYVSLDLGYTARIIDGTSIVVRNQDDQAVAALSPLESVTVGLLDGRRNESTVLECLQLLAGNTGLISAQNCLKRLDPVLRRTKRPEMRAMPGLEELVGVQVPDRRMGLRTLPGPRVLHWWVTNACPRRCVYCFANPDHTGQTEDGIISRERLREIFEEADSLGAEQLLVAGGEPFLRKDLPEILGDAINSGLQPLATTKFPINENIAYRLRAAGMRHLCLSVDSINAETNQNLVGSSAIGPQLNASVAALKSAGIEFSFEFVATSINHQELEEVAQWSADSGARVLLVVPFEPVLHLIGRYTNEQMLLPEDSNLLGRIERLNDQHLELSVEAFEDIGSKPAAPHCDIGKTKLFFDPFGRVHRCYKLLKDKTLFGPDLRKVSVAAAWHSDEFNSRLLASKKKYSKATCGTCGAFQSCHDDGRCIFKSKLDHGTYFDRDRSCRGPY